MIVSLRPTKGIWIILIGGLWSVCSVCWRWLRHSDIFVGKSDNVQAVLRDTARQGGKIPACVPRTQLRVPWRDAAVLLFSADCLTGRVAVVCVRQERFGRQFSARTVYSRRNRILIGGYFPKILTSAQLNIKIILISRRLLRKYFQKF